MVLEFKSKDKKKELLRCNYISYLPQHSHLLGKKIKIILEKEKPH